MSKSMTWYYKIGFNPNSISFVVLCLCSILLAFISYEMLVRDV